MSELGSGNERDEFCPMCGAKTYQQGLCASCRAVVNTNLCVTCGVNKVKNTGDLCDTCFADFLRQPTPPSPV